MSFSSDAKEEMIHQPLGKACCMLSEISALTMTSGALALMGGGRIRVTWSVDSAALARRVFLLLKERLGLTASVTYIRSSRYGGQNTSVLTLEGDKARTLLLALHMMEEDEDGTVSLKRTSPRPTITRQCCARAFLRGSYLGCGTMSTPEKGYHLEWVVGDPNLRQTLGKVLERQELPVHDHVRSGKTVVYLKGAQQISDVLAMMGASGTMLRLENIRIQKQMHGAVNRAASCDEHNTDRMLTAAERQVEAIHTIAVRDGLESLPPALLEAARLRIAQPEMSLTELGQMMEPPVGKSGMNNRMRRLLEIAGETDKTGEDKV